uniref:F-box-like family protein n=1 Tax=Pithovirus LCPAC403 TaxID=2506596 RepID=A0A481ZC05_9VIRU|nr:MAG: uncharacterized protein LCPAC403_00060 [Pithovirus LCPAC403]
MSSVEEILKRVRLKKEISSTEIEEILLDINTNEISILCRTDKRFNTVCKRESFWRNRVTSHYGVDNPILGKTWKDTARIFFQADMINLGKEWVNGMTYKELIEESYYRGSESLLYLHHLKDKMIDEVLESKNNSTTVFYFETDHVFNIMADNLVERNITTLSDDELVEKIKPILTKELGVIAAAVAIRYFSYPELPGVPGQGEIIGKWLTEVNYTGNERKNTDEMSVNIDEMFEYISYVMSYSSLGDENLMDYITPDTGGEM